jgi:hypothetical protein
MLPPSVQAPSSADGPASDLDEEDILKEVAILRGLGDSPFVLRLREYYLAAEAGVVYLVTDLLLGGQLLDALLAQREGAYGERDARAAFTAVRQRAYSSVVVVCAALTRRAARAGAAAARPALPARARHHAPRRQGTRSPRLFPSHSCCPN